MPAAAAAAAMPSALNAASSSRALFREEARDWLRERTSPCATSFLLHFSSSISALSLFHFSSKSCAWSCSNASPRSSASSSPPAWECAPATPAPAPLAWADPAMCDAPSSRAACSCCSRSVTRDSSSPLSARRSFILSAPSLRSCCWAFSCRWYWRTLDSKSLTCSVKLLLTLARVSSLEAACCWSCAICATRGLVASGTFAAMFAY
mmetsp:Transcript_3948/g.10145  ORF Transcript_3948/g.10145 Transcript_3948/m.10145 type:complete len:207 (-) Transcript_3948:497-1117(-)